MRSGIRSGVCREMYGLWRDSRRQVLQDDLSTTEASRQQYSGYVGSAEYDEEEDGVGQSFTSIMEELTVMPCGITFSLILHCEPTLQLFDRVSIWAWSSVPKKRHSSARGHVIRCIALSILKFGDLWSAMGDRGGDGNHRATAI